MIQAIQWDVTPEIIDGWDTPNLYGLLFVTGLILGYFVVRKMFRKEGIPDESLDSLVLYMVLATIIGARLGHVLFYGPYWDTLDPSNGKITEIGYFSHPMEIFKVWKGGLASHGGAIAILISLFWYSRKVVKKPFLWILDRIAAPIAIGGTFIRLGNLMNSEIVGTPTDLPWAFEFTWYYDSAKHMYDASPRHPSQLYESLAYLLIFIVLIIMYWKRNGWKYQGRVFGAFLILLFGARFLIEFTKLEQADGRGDWMFNTGQLLSIPFVLAGIYILWRSFKPEAYMAGVDPTLDTDPKPDLK